jgi:VanZ family protein
MRRAAAALYVAAITAGSLLPAEVAGRIVPSHQGFHFAAYRVMTLAVYWAGPRTRGSVVLGALFCVAWGAILEGLQGLVPGRATEWQDLVENSAGALAGSLICAAVRLKGGSRPADGTG